MTEIRRLLCESADATAPLLGVPALTDRFDQPSALAEFPVRGLAGHLMRALTVVEGYLDAPAPASATPAVTAAGYYAAALGRDTADVGSDLNRTIRQRGLESAPQSPGGFPAAWAEASARLRARLSAEPEGRLVAVFGGMVLDLDDYLVTRLVELTVHGDDLAVSLGAAPPPLPPEATALVIATLVEVARLRHGDVAVVRALTRRERDASEALRVI